MKIHVYMFIFIKDNHKKKTQEFHKKENDLLDASLDSLQWDFRP